MLHTFGTYKYCFELAKLESRVEERHAAVRREGRCSPADDRAAALDVDALRRIAEQHEAWRDGEGAHVWNMGPQGRG